MHRPVIQNNDARVRLNSSIRAGNSAAAWPPGHEGYFQLRISSTGKSSIAGIIACFILAFICLAGGIYQTHRLLLLTDEGKRADAQVVGIDVGVRGGKRAVLQFVTDTGHTAVSRDLFLMLAFRFHKGDHVTVLYSPSDPDLATIDLGLWTWQEPVIFYFGFVFLGILGLLLSRSVPAQKPGLKQ